MDESHALRPSRTKAEAPQVWLKALPPMEALLLFKGEVLPFMGPMLLFKGKVLPFMEAMLTIVGESAVILRGKGVIYDAVI